MATAISNMFDMSEDEFKQVLGMLADTVPDLEIVDNIENYLDGRDRLSNNTFNFLQKNKDRLLEWVEKYIRNPIDK